jgi:DNA-binding NarL/FixJ family response regulator
MLARGYRICEMSQKLKVSQSALMVHKTRAFDWLCLSCNADATAYAIKHNLIEGTLGVVIRNAPRAAEV